MTEKQSNPYYQTSNLRKQAEEEIILKKEAQSPENPEAVSPEETRQVLHELRVHQIELEIQNEELRRTQAELEISRARYFDLYDLAPVGYFTMSEKGLILEANLTAATLLGMPRSTLIKLPFSQFILKEDHGIYYRYHKKLFETGAGKCELRIVKKDCPLFWGHLEANAVQDVDGKEVSQVSMIDITECKHIENELLFQNEIITSMAEAFYLVKMDDGIIVYTNTLFEEMFGYEHNEMIGKHVSIVNAPTEKNPEETAKEIMNIINQKGSWQGEVLNIRKDGTPFWCYASVSLFNHSKYGSAIVTIHTEITERKNMENQLKESEEKYRLLFTSMISGFTLLEMIYDEEGKPIDCRYIDANPAHEKLTGLKKEAIIGRTVRESIPGIEDYWIENYGRVDKTCTPEYFENYVEGLSSWYSVFVFRTAPGFVAVTFENITERKCGEESLKEAERAKSELLTKLNEAQSIGMIGSWEWNVQTNHVWWSDETYRIFRVTPQDFVPSFKENGKFIHHDDLVKYNKAFEHSLQTGEPLNIDLRLVTDDGLQKQCLANGKLFYDDSGQPIRFTGTITDITNRKLAENQIKSLLQEKELLLREVHHRIKNNMNVITSLLSLQADALDEPSAVAALQDSKGRVRSMMVLYDKLYQSSDFRAISSNEYLGSLINEIINNFPNHGSVTVEKQIDDFILDAKILSPIGIILNELLTNTMKYAFIGRANGVIGVSLSINETHATLIIQDNGIGMPESVDILNSTGFGMQLVNILTEQLEGSIRIERHEGTKFVLEFEV